VIRQTSRQTVKLSLTSAKLSRRIIKAVTKGTRLKDIAKRHLLDTINNRPIALYPSFIINSDLTQYAMIEYSSQTDVFFLKTLVRHALTPTYITGPASKIFTYHRLFHIHFVLLTVLILHTLLSYYIITLYLWLIFSVMYF
jgi:hypothetical protein